MFELLLNRMKHIASTQQFNLRLPCVAKARLEAVSRASGVPVTHILTEGGLQYCYALERLLEKNLITPKEKVPDP